ncbi:MAG TPA: PAS domain-containing sensor histidine kinase [Pseudomonadales bacterium]|nr:PAS domain-containing sensor histidine kinase [Pseudomonadales bacterium]
MQKRVKNVKKKATSKSGHWVSETDFAQLQSSLREAQETLNAIRTGEVDAVVVHGPHGNQVFSLTSAEQPYRYYVERMQEGAVTISQEGMVLYANRRFADMVSKPLQLVISTRISDYLDDATCEKIQNVFANQNQPVKHESILQSSNKKTLPVHLAASLLPLQDQNVLCLVVTDLTLQKQNEELRLAKEVAEKANKAKDDFLAALSHELRTPLNPVLLLSSEGAEDAELPARIRGDFATIRDNIELEARLIDDLLDLNRIVHGKLGLEKHMVDCHAVLHDAIAIVEPEIQRKNITLSVSLEKESCQLNADRTRLQQVFWNVLKNAVKFTPDNGKITIQTSIDPDKKNWTITFSDTGIGLTPEEIKKIFEAFSQGEHAESTGSHRFGGLGLGLSITRMLIKMHEGTITAQSEGRDKGATFTIRLPLAKNNPAKAGSTVNGSKAARARQ